jgi:uncharacterized protein YjbI with pentapeptide repeats
MGNADYAGAAQEDFDTLFQLLDENYNEVIVDGAEVAISAIAVGPVLGSGFYSAGTVTLQLSDTLPVGNYRLAYARESTLATLPNDALIRADIRGLHEAAAESAKRSVVVVAVDGTYGPAEYMGADALEVALTALVAAGDGCTVFVRPGTYTFSASFDVSIDDISIIGDGFSSTGVVLVFAGGDDFTISGNQCSVEGVRFQFAAGSGIRWQGDDGRVTRVVLEDGEFELSGSRFVGEQLTTTATGASLGLIVRNNTGVELRNSSISSVDQVALTVRFATQLHLTNCAYACNDATCYDLQDTLSYATITSCTFSAADGLALFVDQADLTYVNFTSCSFSSAPALVTSSGVVDCYVPVPGVTTSRQLVTFEECLFQGTGSAAYQNSAFRFVSTNSLLDSMGIRLVNCVFEDDTCSFEDGAGGGVPGMFLQGVHLENCVLSFANNLVFNEDGPLVEAWDCYGRRCTVYAPTAAPASVAVVSAAAVELYRGCNFYNTVLIGGNGDWSRPFLHLEGDSGGLDPNPLTGSPVRRGSLVDGLEVHNYGSLGWVNVTADSPIVAEVAGYATLRRFHWTEYNSAGGATQAHCLVRVVGHHAVVDQCHMIIGSAPTAPNLGYFILVHGGADYARITRNHLQTSDGRAITHGMVAMIFVDSTALLECRGGIISENHCVWYGDASAPGVPADLEGIIVADNVAGSVTMWRIVNNHIFVGNLTANAWVILWEVGAVLYPTGGG